MEELLDGIVGADFGNLRWWRRGWGLFLADGGEDHPCLIVTDEDGGEPSQLVAYRHDREDHPVEFPDFEAWPRRLAASLEAGDPELT